MKAVTKLLSFCIVIFFANLTFIAAQTDSNGKGKSENVKPLSETSAQNTVSSTNPKTNVSDDLKKDLKGEIYRVGFQDAIEVTVDRHPELSQKININSDGTIRMLRIDNPIVAICKTEEELREAITEQYKSYLKRPSVKVVIVDKRTKSYGVIGAVQKPGNFYYDRQISLIELLTHAGGQNVEFAGSKIQIARVGGKDRCSANPEKLTEDDIKFIAYNLNDVIEGKERVWLEPGDIVSVSIAEEAYVVGNVLKPTKVLLNEPKTLTQAIASAGGIDETAKTDKVIIERYERGTGIKKELVFNLKDIREQKIPDPQLQANDIVQVSNDKLKSVKKGILDIFKNTIPQRIARPY